MHCQLNPKIVYTEFTSVIRKQREVSQLVIYDLLRIQYLYAEKRDHIVMSGKTDKSCLMIVQAKWMFHFGVI